MHTDLVPGQWHPHYAEEQQDEARVSPGRALRAQGYGIIDLDFFFHQLGYRVQELRPGRRSAGSGNSTECGAVGA